jgi:hypothetical protein
MMMMMLPQKPSSILRYEYSAAVMVGGYLAVGGVRRGRRQNVRGIFAAGAID